MQEVWNEVGAFGLYQQLLLAALPLAVVAIGGNFLVSSYLILEPEWTCDSGPNATFRSSWCLTWALVARGLQRKAFGLWRDCSRNCTVWHECSNPRYRSEFYSIGEQYGLLCEQAYISHSIVSLGIVPTIIGQLVWGPMADALGRKLPVLLSTLLMMGGSVGCVLAPTWPIFTAFRMLFGLGFGGNNVYVVWAMEFSDQDHGFLINALTHWHYTYMIVAILGWATRDWQRYLIILNAFCSPILLIFAFYVKESPRWYIQKGDYAEALRVLEDVRRWNTWLRPRHLKELQEEDVRDADPVDPNKPSRALPRLNFCSLFDNRTNAIRSATLFFTFFAASIVSGTVILDVGRLSGGAFQNLFLIGLFRCFTPFMSVLLDWKFRNLGRRQFLLGSQTVVLLCFLGVWGLHNLSAVAEESELVHRATAFFSLSGAILNMFVWIVIIQLAFELYPTLLRNTAVAFTGVADTAGSVLVPQIVYLGRYWGAAPASLAIALLLLAMISGWLVFPETKEPPQPLLKPADADLMERLLQSDDDEQEEEAL